jgi:hypothetical protein
MLFTKPTYNLFCILLLASGIAVFTGCRKIPKFSETPNIQYKNIRKVTFFNADQLIDADSIIVGIHFEDGNGDIGFPEDQRSEANTDYFVDVYRQTNGVFAIVVFDDSLTFNSNLPLLAPVSASGPLEGDIFHAMTFNYSSTQASDDTLKFVIKLKDRAGNFSNSVETDPIIIRKTP